MPAEHRAGAIGRALRRGSLWRKAPFPHLTHCLPSALPGVPKGCLDPAFCISQRILALFCLYDVPVKTIGRLSKPQCISRRHGVEGELHFSTFIHICLFYRVGTAGFVVDDAQIAIRVSIHPIDDPPQAKLALRTTHHKRRVLAKPFLEGDGHILSLKTA